MKRKIKSLSICMVVCLLFLVLLTAVPVSAAEIPSTSSYESIYVDYLIEAIGSGYDSIPDDYQWYTCNELYYHYADTSQDTAEPDYILVLMHYFGPLPAHCYDIFGSYAIWSGGNYQPYELAYFVFTPEDSKIYTLREAYDMGIEGVESVFTDYGLGILIGDVDSNRELNVKDATYIQKCSAGLCEYSASDQLQGGFLSWDQSMGESRHYTLYVSDYNLDGERNVKDATAIQKLVAHIG